MREDLLWLTAVINQDWLEERRLDTQVIRLYQEPSLIKGYVNDMLLQDIIYNPRVGVNIIPKHVVDIYFPTHPRSKSDILLKLKHRGLLANHGVIRVIPVVLRDKRIYLDFHVFDLPEGPTPLILVGIPIASLIHSIPPGLLKFQFGKEVMRIGISRSLNTRAEAKPEVDPLDEVNSNSLEMEEDQQSLEEEADDFSMVDELQEFEKLGESLRPDLRKSSLKLYRLA
jgi:hypothetical protein